MSMSRNQLAGVGRTVAVTRGIVWTVLGASVLLGLAVLVAGVSSIVTDLVDGRVPITLLADQELPPAADQGAAVIESGSYETANVVIENLSTLPVTLATVSAAIGILTQLTVIASVVILAWRLLRARPFQRSLSWAVTLAGAALLIGGLLSQGLHGFATMMSADELNAVGSDPGDGFWPLAAAIDPTSIALGFVFLLVGLAFEHGEKLQRETEGLV